MIKSRCFQQSLRTSTSQISIFNQDQQCVRQPPQKIRQSKFTKTYAKLINIPLEINIPTLNPNNIQHLYLSHNKIKTLSGIQNYPNIISLNVSYNSLTVIEQIKMIRNPQNIIRIGLKMNDFVYGYQDYAVKIFTNLQKLDDICVKDKLKVKQMWQKGQKIACDFLEYFIRIQRVLYFMNDLIGKSKLHQQMGLKQQKSFYCNPQLKLLFQNMNEKFIAKVSLNYIMPTAEQFLSLSSIQILDKIKSIISISLEQQIDLKCTCRPRLSKNQEIKNTFKIICQSFLNRFAKRYNKQLQHGLIKVDKKLKHIYPERKWQKWQLYGMMQNYLQLSTGGKKISQIVNEKRQKFVFDDQAQKLTKRIQKVKKCQLDQNTKWRNEVFSDIKINNQEQKQNYSPNLQISSLKYKAPSYINKKQVNEQHQTPQLYFDRIPMILYEKNYIQVLLQITMVKIKQMLDKYDYLVRIQKQSIQNHINKFELIKRQKQNKLTHKVKISEKINQIQSQRHKQMIQTKRNNSYNNKQNSKNICLDQRMLKSTLVNNSPYQNDQAQSEIQTTTRPFMQRKQSQISFGRTNEDEQLFSDEQKFNKQIKQKRRKHKKQNKNQNNKNKINQFYKINLIYKVLRSLKLNLLINKNKYKSKNC